jgi:hypothetical protein
VDEDGEQEELFHPKQCFNPVIQRFHENVAHRALTGDNMIQSVDARVKAYLTVNEGLLANAKTSIDIFRQEATLKESEG